MQLVRVGKLDEAEAKARQAQRMNVVPPVTSDRAESVLHEIAMARATKGQETIAYNPPQQPASEPMGVSRRVRSDVRSDLLGYA